ncbi:exosome complex protein Rrp4 [Candidatus Woesearchaeota archaeon]|nr:exosome complex protein Rrp4 [Candidatus Woesearchaeota archaeon]MBW3005305.1 exosome complex protein Rrp4 [Candidatus Woesearchaeota archaeon]
MTDKLKIKNKEIAVPGEVLAEGMGFVPSKGIRREKDKLVAEQLGMINIEGKVIKLIPLTGVYIPKTGDKIIAKVIDVLMTGWRLDTRSPYSAVLSMKDATSDFIQRGADLTQYFALGDYVLTKITNVTSQKLVDVSMKGPGLRKLKGGRILQVNPHKVPRVIGKEGSMVVMIKQATGCNILVGQNGWIWIDGEPEAEVIAEKAVMKINAEAHLSGLTDNIKEFLEKLTKKKITLEGGKNEKK